MEYFAIITSKVELNNEIFDNFESFEEFVELIVLFSKFLFKNTSISFKRFNFIDLFNEFVELIIELVNIESFIFDIM